MRFSTALLSLVASSFAAYVPSEPWSTLTPTATMSCGVSDYTKTFGIAISTITSGVNVKAKRGLLTQIGDGQIQADTETKPLSTVATTRGHSDSVTTETVKVTYYETITSTSGTVVTTYPTTRVSTTAIEITSHKFSYSSVTATAGDHPAVVITQIGDGQIQAPHPESNTSGSTTYSFRTLSTKTTSSSSSSSTTGTKTISTSSSILASSSSTACPTGPIAKVATCKSSSDLNMSLDNGILTDSKGRIGSIVANRQFQFDGPPPQAGAIYAAGWSIVDGHLAIGSDDIFWECLSGDFYNLYDEYISEQCVPVYLNVVDLVDC